MKAILPSDCILMDSRRNLPDHVKGRIGGFRINGCFRHGDLTLQYGVLLQVLVNKFSIPVLSRQVSPIIRKFPLPSRFVIISSAGWHPILSQEEKDAIGIINAGKIRSGIIRIWRMSVGD